MAISPPALGIPTLDGLGGVGDGAHAPHEHILISELPRRAALLAGLIERPEVRRVRQFSKTHGS